MAACGMLKQHLWQLFVSARISFQKRSMLVLATILWIILVMNKQNCYGQPLGLELPPEVIVPMINQEFYQLNPIQGGYQLRLHHPDGFERNETVRFNPVANESRLQGHLRLPFEGKGGGVATLNYEIDREGRYSVRYSFRSNLIGAVPVPVPVTIPPIKHTTVSSDSKVSLPPEIDFETRLGATSLKTSAG